MNQVCYNLNIYYCGGIIFEPHIIGQTHLRLKAWDDVLGVIHRSYVTANDTSAT